MERAPHNNAAHATDTRAERRRLELQIQSLRDRRREIEFSDDRAYTNGRIAEIDRQIREVENTLAQAPVKR